MKSISTILEDRISSVMQSIAGDQAENPPAIVKPTQDPKFGDYQANGVMGLAKKLKTKPRDLAEKIVEKLDLSDMCQEVEIAGPGFINLHLKTEWLASRLAEAITDDKRLGIDPVLNPPTVVVDFSGPNIAKQMHVGHLRSTIIGDVISRVLEFLYNDPTKVVRQNHIGDWGLQMGMVVYALNNLVFKDYVDEHGQQALDEMRKKHPAKLDQMVLDAGTNLDLLEQYYKKISKIVKEDDNVAQMVRDSTYVLQGGNPHLILLWQMARTITLRACVDVYGQLDVKLSMLDICGESNYADQLPKVIQDLSSKNMLQVSDGAQSVFMDGFKNRDGEPLPLIVQKTDGAYLYATTDLAAIRYRSEILKANRVIYVTDARQNLHFEMVFACARQAGWVDDAVSLEHVPFGTVLGENGKPFKTKEGESPRLKDLLDEAEKRALEIVKEKNPNLDDSQKVNISKAVGIGAVKYADLSSNLVSDYVFSWDKMLSFEGNTAPYIQYSFTRVQSIFRKGKVDVDALTSQAGDLTFTDPFELALGKMLLRYGEAIEMVARDLRPHLLTNYLFELAQTFHAFFAHCPVLTSEEPVRTSRLLLCYLTSKTIEHGLSLLGIETMDQM